MNKPRNKPHQIAEEKVATTKELNVRYVTINRPPTHTTTHIEYDHILHISLSDLDAEVFLAGTLSPFGE